MRFYLTISLLLFFCIARSQYTPKQVSDAASAYRFMVDSIWVKDLATVGLTDTKLAFITVPNGKKLYEYSSDPYIHAFRLKLAYYSKNFDSAYLNQIINQSVPFDLNMISKSDYFNRCSELKTDAERSNENLTMLCYLQNTSIISIYNAVISEDGKYCIIYCSHFHNGSYILELKRNHSHWEIQKKTVTYLE